MPSRLVRTLALALFAVFALGLLACAAGCIREPSPQLVQVLEITPRDLELGDRVQILGAGFPQGRAAHLAFRGSLRRPGQRPIDGVELTTDGTVTSSQQIELAIDERALSLFCGVATEAEHTTFDGELEVSFAAAEPGAAPVAATLYKVTLDLRPPLGRAGQLEKRIKEGERALKYVGAIVSAEPAASGGLVIDKVLGGSRAEQAGLSSGDVLVAFDGVRVASPADAVPHPGAQTVTMAVRRGTDPREQYREVAIDGFRRAPPEELLRAAMIVALACAVVLLLFSPIGRRFSWIERRVASRLRSASSGRGGVVAAMRDAIQSALGGASLAEGTRVPPYLVCLALSAAMIVFPFVQFRLAAGADVGILFLVVVLSLSLLMLVCGLRASLRVLSYQLPAAIAVVCVVVMTGSLRLNDIVRAQGGWPWQWYALRSPVAALLFALFIVSALPTHDGAPAVLVEADGPVRASPRTSLLACADWAHVFVMAALASALFLGGWQLPGVDASQATGHPMYQLLAGLAFVGKAWTLVVGAVLTRWALPRLTADVRARAAWKYLVPTALVAFALTVGWVFVAPGRDAQALTSGATFAFAVLLAVRAVLAIRHAYADAGAQPRLNPFL